MAEYKIYNRPEEEIPFILPKYNDSLTGPFNPKIYGMLPLALQGLFETIDNQSERDILLLGMLTVLSGCMPNVSGFYDRRWIHPNIYTFIEAPAGAGKGVLSWARLLGTPVHQLLREETRLAKLEYEALRKEKAKQKDSDGKFLQEPGFKMLFIPVNNSASSIVQTLAENDGAGILFSTEADTLTNSLSQDWGNFSDVLRCAFHHEPIDLQRRLNREYLSIEHPRLSVLLTGTKGQLLRLIPDTENGLFSRFIYYSFPAIPNFRNVFERNGTDPGKSFKEMGHTVVGMYTYLKALPEPIQLYLVEEDHHYFIEEFKNITKFTYKDSGTPILATVHRLGLITFRVAMILSVFRHFTNPDKKIISKLRIDKNDFVIAIELAYHILYHATMLVAEMKEGSKQILQQSRLMSLYDKLPEKFTRFEANELASKINISNASLGRYLVNGHFERIGQGKYRKLPIHQSNEVISN